MSCIICNPTKAALEELNHRHVNGRGVGVDTSQLCAKHGDETAIDKITKLIDRYIESTPYPPAPTSWKGLVHPQLSSDILPSGVCCICSSDDDEVIENCVFRLHDAKFVLYKFPVCKEHSSNRDRFEKAGRMMTIFLGAQTLAMHMKSASTTATHKKTAPKKKMEQSEKHTNDPDNERLVDNTGKILQLAKAWAQIEIAHTSLKNAYETLKQFESKHLPGKILKREMREVRKLAKDMAHLGMKTKAAADEEVDGEDEQAGGKEKKIKDKGEEIEGDAQPSELYVRSAEQLESWLKSCDVSSGSHEDLH